MVDEIPDDFPRLGEEELDPKEDYRWSGYLVQRKVKKPAKRIMIGSYEEWFRWYMRFQRFRAFHTLVLVEPLIAVTDNEHGGYIDGLLARLMGKVSQVVVVTKGGVAPPVADRKRVVAVVRALLYGTRLSKPDILEQVARTFAPVDTVMVEDELRRQDWRISKYHPRYQLEKLDEELLQGMMPELPRGYIFGKPDQIEQLFEREPRFHRELAVPDEMLRERVLEDVAKKGWVTVPYEWERVSFWLEGLNKAADSRLEEIYRSQEHVGDRQWLALLAPPKRQVRRVLEGLAAEGRLEQRVWFREIGRPTFTYQLPGKALFLEARCGQCAFYISAKRRCRLWWLVNKRRVFYDDRWKQPDSTVTGFEIHKMRWASRIGPHSSACQRFIDKKRDHNRKAIPANCEICGESIRPREDGREATCGNCRTKYVSFRDRVKVLTAYEHEYERLYNEITGGNAKIDLETWKKDLRSRVPFVLQQATEVDDLDVLADEAETEEPPRAWPKFDQGLQEKVDRLAATTDIAKKLSAAMGQSALNATNRIIEIAKLYPSEIGSAIILQEKYLAQIETASQNKLLTLEAFIMKQYWHCFGAALKGAQQWFGHRKRSRFVREFVEDQAGKARGYSAFDAAINYLHQRRLRQAERINAMVGFPGTCDGFLHKERYNSRGIGLLLDMIDPFKFADREELLVVALDGGISWTDFRLEKDRRGSTFYYPASSAKAKLDLAGVDADNLVVPYKNRQMHISEAFKEFASNLLQALEDGSQGLTEFEPFMFT